MEILKSFPHDQERTSEREIQAEALEPPRMKHSKVSLKAQFETTEWESKYVWLVRGVKQGAVTRKLENQNCPSPQMDRTHRSKEEQTI